jgi:hypothetical protein
MVPSVPVTTASAVTGPLTGGQIFAQPPLQLDLVAVSGANQYKVKPAAFVSTVAPLIVAVFSAALDDAWLAGVLAGLLELAEELPHAAVISVAAAISAATRYLFRIRDLPSARKEGIYLGLCLFRALAGSSFGCYNDQIKPNLACLVTLGPDSSLTARPGTTM